MSAHNSEQVKKQCQDFLDTLGVPGFIILGWKQPDNTFEVVQSMKEMNPVAYTKGVVWALNEATKNL